MASQWMYDVGGLQFGPVTFLNLAELITDRRLGEDDLVRRNDSDDWTRARDVVGLMHTVRTIEADRAELQSDVDSPPDEDEAEFDRRTSAAAALEAEAERITLRKRPRTRRQGQFRGSEIAARVLLVWMVLVGVVIAGLAFYNHVHDPFADKRFEEPPVDGASIGLDLMR